MSWFPRAMRRAVQACSLRRFASLLPLALVAVVHCAHAQVWAPKPDVALDTGNWSNATFEELQIRLNGFRGYETTYGIGINALKLHHPQHIVRLPNKKGADGLTRAYFAITHSNRFYREAKVSYYTDGYWLVAEIDADAYDQYTDRIVDTPGSDGQYVYEEHFSNDRDEAKKEYSDELAAKGAQMVISNLGDWAHPAKMTQFDGILIMVAQNWSPIATVGSSLDAVLFFDVRDPVSPVFLGRLDSVQLDIPTGHGDGGKPSSWRKIDAIGLARSQNGVYHLGVQGKNFFCHETQDCFIDPSIPDKWVPEDVVAGRGGLGMAGGQGDNFQSLENYASVPNADETCYDSEGNAYPAGQSRPAECMPAGEFRTMWFEPIGDSVLPNSFDTACDIFGKECESGDANKNGLPAFSTLKYDSAPNYLATGTTLQATTHFAGKYSSGPKNKFMYQLAGHCGPSSGIHVNNQNEPLIFCVSESDNEPIDCPEGSGECNRIWQNAASAAPSHGAIKFTNSTGAAVIYRGRGLTNVTALSAPPWGPGLAKGAVDWNNSTITQIEVLSGTWLVYTSDGYGTPGTVSTLPPGLYGRSLPVKSFRALPETGIAMFEHAVYFGRMLSSIGSNAALQRACGDDEAVCYAFERENDCNVFGKNCETPRTFNDKASSVIVVDGTWTLHEDEGYGGKTVHTLNPVFQGGRYPRLGDYGFNDEATSVSTPEQCSRRLLPPTSISVAIEMPGRPLISWLNAAAYSFYEIDYRPAGGPGQWVTSRRYQNRFMPSVVLAPGNYEVRVRTGISASNNCRERWSAYTAIFAFAIPKVPVQLQIGQISWDKGGLGEGSVTVSPDPVSTVGGIFYTPGDIVMLTAVPTKRSEFERWNGAAASCGTSAVCQFTIPEGDAIAAQAVFRPKPSLTVFNVGGGTRDENDELVLGGTIGISPPGDDCGRTAYTCLIYSTGDEIALTATARDGARFDGWRGDADCEDGFVTMNGNRRCEAVFKSTSYELTVDQTPGVQITSDPAGEIDCGTQNDCAQIYPVADGEQTRDLTAAIDPDYVFVRWSGLFDCYDENERDNNPLTARVTVGTQNVHCDVVAVPAGTEYALTIEKIGGGAVSAEATPTADSSGISCSQHACSQSYPVNTVVKLFAKASRGSEFIGFQSPDVGSDGYRQENDDCIDGEINMIANVSCTASFKTKILVVNGDYDSTSKEQNPYIGVLRNQPLVDYAIWHVQNPNSGDNTTDPATGQRRIEPVAEDLAKYGRVVWYTGDASESRATTSPVAGPSAAGEQALASYLDSGGCLLLSSPEYYKDRGVTPFMRNYLGISGVAEQDVVESYVKGAGEARFGFSELTTDAGTGLEGYFSITDGQNGEFLSDALTHDPDIPGSDVIFTYREGGGDAAVVVDSGVYRSVFMGFPFLAIPSGDRRNNTMRAFLEFCGQPDSDDLFEVNDTLDSALELTGHVSLNAVRVVTGNDDFFKWTSEWFAATTIGIEFDHAKGDLALEVYDSEQNLLGLVDSQDNGEQVTLDYVDAGQVFYLRVFGVDGAAAAYELNITASGASDRDHDGVEDVGDALPDDPSEQTDADTDLIGDNADADDDNDGMPDAYEIANALHPLVANGPFDDADADGFPDGEEYNAGADPQDPDSRPASANISAFVEQIDRDNDGITDDIDPDDDNDGLPDEYEQEQGTDRRRAVDALLDNDDDGFSNLSEFRASTLPNDPNSKPVASTAPTIAASVLPTSRSAVVGSTVTAFATMINVGEDAGNCAFVPQTVVPAEFTYRTTDPATNAVIGGINAPASMVNGAAQSFVFAITPLAAFAPTRIEFQFACDTGQAAISTAGLNTLLLSASAAPVPDIVALAATLTNDGIANIPGSNGAGVFAVASVNVGSGGAITVTADTGGATLPVAVNLCQTNPVTGVCINPTIPAPSVDLVVGANETPTFSFFISGLGDVPFDPANNRVFVSFKDATGAVRGSTSVAIRTVAP